MIDKTLLEKIKEVSLPAILADFGIRPSPQTANRENYRVYIASYRGEQHPSLSVFKTNNSGQWLFRDHTTGEVGTNLDLLVLFGFFSNWREAAAFVAKKYLGTDLDSCWGGQLSRPHFYDKNPVQSPQYGGIILSVNPIVGSPAVDYIVEARRIPTHIAAPYVNFVRYAYSPGGRIYSGIGWPTIRGGWSIRWSADIGKGKGKACVGPAGISVFQSAGLQSDTCLVFEGIFDFLSHLTISSSSVTGDAIVMNSVSHVSETITKLSEYHNIRCYLDNDGAGREATSKIIRQFGHRVTDESSIFAGFNDYNDFLKSQFIKPWVKQ